MTTPHTCIEQRLRWRLQHTSLTVLPHVYNFTKMDEKKGKKAHHVETGHAVSRLLTTPQPPDQVNHDISPSDEAPPIYIEPSSHTRWFLRQLLELIIYHSIGCTPPVVHMRGVPGFTYPEVFIRSLPVSIVVKAIIETCTSWVRKRRARARAEIV